MIHLIFAVMEMTERFAFYGLASNLITFLTNEFGQSTATAAKQINTWIGVSCMFPILGGFLADSILGRFKTVLLSSFIYLLVCISIPYLNRDSFSKITDRNGRVI